MWNDVKEFLRNVLGLSVGQTLFGMVFAGALLFLGYQMFLTNVSVMKLGYEMTVMEARIRGDFKAEIAALRSELKAEIAAVRSELKAEIAAVWKALEVGLTSVRGDMALMESRLKAEIAAVRDELKAEIAAVRDELKAEIVAVWNALKTEVAQVDSDLSREIVMLKDNDLAHLSDGVSEIVFLLKQHGVLSSDEAARVDQQLLQ
ncbi:MAG: hypothetical protein LBR38_05745 [Synergistaceae bacterium]|nr:hypothetical protein [Synergistaceae bacterium]